MPYTSIEQFLSDKAARTLKGPVAVVLAEDRVEVDSTLTHHLAAGFREVILLAADGVDPSPALAERVRVVRHGVFAEGALFTAMNALIDALPGLWLYYCYNGEYLFHPFCEVRNVRELTAFHTEERRDALLSYVIDLYAGDLDRFQNAVSRDEAMLDRSGYYALGRPDAGNHGHPRQRQLDFFGGLRWRFEEHVPPARRKIDRSACHRLSAAVGAVRACVPHSDRESQSTKRFLPPSPAPSPP